jgi:hypothetical protein
VADCIGGWTGDNYEAKAIMALVKGGTSSFPVDLTNEITQTWNLGFDSYYNDDETPFNERTLGFYRTKTLRPES